jgi:predicted TIM-barrel fold metal-dependent hydrolase
MATAGVERAVLVQAVGAYSDDNRYALDAAAAGLDRFAAVVVVDPRGAEPAATLRRHVREQGAAGIRMFAIREPEGVSVDAEEYRPLWDEAADLLLPVVVTVWTRQLDGVAAVAAAYPDLPVVIDHCAFPTFPGGLGPVLDLAVVPNVSVKVSGHLFHEAQAGGERSADVVATLVGRYGADRVIWGSDFPQTAAPHYRDLVVGAREATAGLPPAEQDAVLGGNARRLWWADGG